MSAAKASAGPDGPEAVLNQARHLLRQGAEAEAETLLRTAMKAAPGHSGLLQYLGVLRLKRGDPAEAESLLAAAVALNPAAADHRVNFGNLLDARGEHAAAADCFRAALALEPGKAAAHGNLGNALMKLGRIAEAAAAYARAAELMPREARYAHSLGAALIEAGRFAEAEAALQRAVALAPALADAQMSLGLARAHQGRHGEAERCYRRALEIEPDHVRAMINLGSALKLQGNNRESAAIGRRVLAIDPSHPEAHANLAAALLALGSFAEAETEARRALELGPGLAKPVYTLSAALEHQGRVAEALSLLERSAAAGPVESRAESHFMLAMALLRQGDFARGWREYEWRWALPRPQGERRREFAAPQWRGEDIAGRTILLHAEQGLGDAIHFMRYAPMVAARGARVILELPLPLVRLARGMAGAATIVAAGDAPPAFDLHCPLMSLPLAFGTVLESIPSTTPYLAPDPEAVAGWRRRLAAGPRGAVGVAWAGNPDFTGDRDRSLDPALLAPLFGIGGIAFHSLQVGAPAERLKTVAGAERVTKLGQEFKDFADTAACVAALDLVIAADTAVAHLAGALGRPVWVLLPFAPDWRWQVDRADSPWYRSATLFRQNRPGNWPEVIEWIAAKLASCASIVNT